MRFGYGRTEIQQMLLLQLDRNLLPLAKTLLGLFLILHRILPKAHKTFHKYIELQSYNRLRQQLRRF